ncbi:hypothetical protein FLAG1_08278 [Fusarium langsethiae]|uniref:SNF2 N-terminal domain-containing protein n=1 Tax=Fusarium langsethiae TaxID=179993 RepID=A0A0M9ESB6_FUSLA|nr:hypothetical protein FLAG1_08278 [Fusarium langsethiae]
MASSADSLPECSIPRAAEGLNHLLEPEPLCSEAWDAQYKTTTSHELLNFDLNIPKLKEGRNLKPWQEIGAGKLADSCNFLLGGLVVGDETGLGKSLMALAAALHRRN